MPPTFARRSPVKNYRFTSAPCSRREFPAGHYLYQKPSDM